MAMRRLPLASLIGLIVCIHVPFLGGGWMTDDFMHIDFLQRQSFSHVFVSPDVFGYFRPIPQATLLANLRIGNSPVAFRAVNLALHVSVLYAAFVFARLLLADTTAAFFTALAFALTPKAHTIAILWTSARPELLMSLFVLLTAICWLRWQRGGRAQWLLGSAVCYVCAILSKEPAVLLPALLVLTPAACVPMSARLQAEPANAELHFRYRFNPIRRFAAAALIASSAAIAIVLRLIAGARIPISDAYYTVVAPLSQDLANAWNYFTRAIPSPAVVWIVAVVAARRVTVAGGRARIAAVAAFSVAWFLVLLFPVLPLPGRSELYLYLPTLGLCILGGLLAAQRAASSARTVIIVALVASAILGAYQLSRASSMHQVLTFSSRLEEALVDNDELRQFSGVLTLIPADAATERALRDSVSGYLDVALKVMFKRHDIGGTIIYPGDPEIPTGLRLICLDDGARVLFIHR